MLFRFCSRIDVVSRVTAAAAVAFSSFGLPFCLWFYLIFLPRLMLYLRWHNFFLFFCRLPNFFFLLPSFIRSYSVAHEICVNVVTASFLPLVVLLLRCCFIVASVHTLRQHNHTHSYTRWRSIFFSILRGSRRKCYRMKISKRLYFLCTCGPIEIVSFRRRKKTSLNDNRTVQSQSHSRALYIPISLSFAALICCLLFVLFHFVRSPVFTFLLFLQSVFRSLGLLLWLGLGNDKWIASYENRPTAHFISTLSVSKAVTARKSTLTAFFPFGF